MASAVRLDSSPSERLSLTGPMSSRRASISRTSAQSTPHSGSNPPSTRAGSALCEARRTRRGQAGRAAMPSRSRIPPRQAPPAAGATPDTAAFPWFAAAHRPGEPLPASTASVGGLPGPSTIATSTTERDRASTASITAPARGDCREDEPVERLHSSVAEGMQDNFLLCEALFRQRGVDCPQNERALFDRKRQAKPDTVAVKLRRTDCTDPVKLPLPQTAAARWWRRRRAARLTATANGCSGAASLHPAREAQAGSGR